MALSAERNVEEKDGIVADIPCAVDIIYRGALCTFNAAGYLAPAGLAVSEVFAGIAEETVDNSGGSAGDKSCKVKRKGRFLLTGSGFAQTDLGVTVYASADDTITKTAGTNPPIGIIDGYVSSTQVWVQIDPAPAAAAAS